MNGNERYEEKFICCLASLEFLEHDSHEIQSKNKKVFNYLQEELNHEKIKRMELKTYLDYPCLIATKDNANELLNIVSQATYVMLQDDVFLHGCIAFGNVCDNRINKIMQRENLPRIIVDEEARKMFGESNSSLYVKQSWNENDVYYVDFLNILCKSYPPSSYNPKDVLNTILECIKYLNENSISNESKAQYEFMRYYFCLSINFIKSLQEARRSEEIQIPDELKI